MGRNLTEVSKGVFGGIKITISLVIFLLTIPLIFYFTYLFGHRILEGPMLGGDTAYHMALIHAIDRYYPKIPMWFPFAGAGSSLVLGYWVFSYYLAIFGSHLSALTLEQWVRLLEFVSVPIICIEIYIYLWVRLKNQVMATLGALLYPLSSMAWGWVAHAGFFSMQISGIFYVPAFLFFDLYLEEELTKSSKIARKRTFLLGFFISMGLGILAHGSFWPNLFLGLPFYALIRSQLSPRYEERRVTSFLRAVKVIIMAVVVGLLAGAFILLPQQRYFSLQPFTPTYGPTDTPYLPWRAFLGFERLKLLSGTVGSLYIPLFMSILVSVFAIIGTAVALTKRHFLGALGLASFFYVWWLSSARYLAIHYPFLALFLLPTATRAASIAAIYLTLMAAYGLWGLADLPGVVIRFLASSLGKIGNVGKILGIILYKFSFLVSTIIVFAVLVWAFFNFRSKQVYPREVNEWGEMKSYFGYGSLDLRVPLCRIPGWENAVSAEEGLTCDDYQPKWAIDTDRADSRFWSDDFSKTLKKLNMDNMTRVSISPYLGWLTFSFNGHEEASMVSAPSGQSILNLGWLGIHDELLFLEGGGQASEVEELAKWFGINYVFMPADTDEKILSRYPEDSWPVVLEHSKVVVRKFQEGSGIVNLSNKPAILVISSKKLQAYVPVFTLAVRGGLSFDKALLIQGKSDVDDYTLGELENFSAIILRGYSYRNRGKAWGLLSKYVENGGSLFIDTGWQYIDKDWGRGPDEKGKFVEIALPNPSPVKKSLWGDVGTTWANASLSSDIGSGLSLKNFGPPAWTDKSWGMALAKRSDIEPWAEPVLTSGDSVIIAKGNFGKGKVVWSGMNLFAHAFDKANEEEYALIKNIFDFLLGPGEKEEGNFSTRWDYPDKVEFALPQIPEGKPYLYFAETYTPDWNAYWVENGKRTSLKVYRAGPGFMSVRIPKSGRGVLIMKYDMGNWLIASFAITITIALLLIISIADAWLFGGKEEKAIKTKLSKLSLFSKINHRGVITFKDEHENY